MYASNQRILADCKCQELEFIWPNFGNLGNLQVIEMYEMEIRWKCWNRICLQCSSADFPNIENYLGRSSRSSPHNWRKNSIFVFKAHSTRPSDTLNVHLYSHIFFLALNNNCSRLHVLTSHLQLFPESCLLHVQMFCLFDVWRSIWWRLWIHMTMMTTMMYPQQAVR